ncbi:MAG: class I SAM-dependent methyltransferase [Gammaproteobacteria bacterium]
MQEDPWKNYDAYKQSNAIARNYYAFVHAAFAEGLKQAAQGRTFERALDIACGSGDSTLQLLPYAGKVSGIDLSPDLIGKALADPKLAGVDFHLGDFLDFALPHRYDLIGAAWFHNFLHTEEEQRRALEKIVAALSDQGAVVFLFPAAAFTSEKAQRYFDRLAWRQAWYEHLPKCSRGVFSFRDSPWDELTSWQPLYLFELYHPYFELHFVDTKKLCVEQGFADEAYLEPPFEVIYGTKRG